MLAGGLDYSPEIAGGEADFHIGYNYSASYRHDVMGYMRQDKYGVWNASASFTPQGSPVRATLFVRNLTNTAYAAGSAVNDNGYGVAHAPPREVRSEEHTSELQSLMRISYAVFCLQKKQ